MDEQPAACVQIKKSSFRWRKPFLDPWWSFSLAHGRPRRGDTLVQAQRESSKEEQSQGTGAEPRRFEFANLVPGLRHSPRELENGCRKVKRLHGGFPAEFVSLTVRSQSESVCFPSLRRREGRGEMTTKRIIGLHTFVKNTQNKKQDNFLLMYV